MTMKISDFKPVSMSITVMLALSAQMFGPKAGELEVTKPNNLGWIRLNFPEQLGRVHTILASPNLSQWALIATTHDRIENYPDAAAPFHARRFYRVATTNRTSSDDWKNQVQFVDDEFRSTPGNVIGPDFQWIKFAIQLDEPFRVYYQDSQKYDFHYDFAVKRLDAFRGLSPGQFDQIALHTNQQQVLLGAILVPPYPNDAEYGIQFAGLDAYPPEFVAHHFQLVKATVAAGGQVRAFYVPAYEQTHAAETNRGFFEAQGIPIASAERWITGDDIYSTGWALGRLKFIPGTEISAAFADGRLQPQDILLTDGVQAEIPVLAGVLSLTPSTPNSHVAILSKSFGLPFAYVSAASARARVQQLVGRDILIRLDPYDFEIRVVELESTMDPAVRQEILSLKSPPKLQVAAKAKFGGISSRTDTLTPADIKFFGGKAANSGFLRREIPNRSPESIAFSFDLWDDFMAQTLPGGTTLGGEIQRRLSGYTYPPNVAALKMDLETIRSLITGTARFTDAQKQAIINALSPFDRSRNIRFRSSTNVEDSEQFTGAGLYDSYSGCLLDDLDNDETGPCQCDPSEAKERGVFRAIQKVYASFYNDNAVIERLRYLVDENAVGMALLVHHSAPDETEMANGVATLQIQRGTGFDSINGDLVTQKGAASVTNPDGTARPEVVSGYHHAAGAGGFLKQRSSLVPLGAYVMEWNTNYVELMNLFARVADGYHAYFPKKKTFTLDFEYKKLVPGVLDVKQVREVPVSISTNSLPAFLIHEDNQYVVFQGEAADVFSNHRLKSFWTFHARNIQLNQTNLWTSLFANIEGDYLDGKQTAHVAGSPAALPNASHAVEEDLAIDRWTVGTGTNRRDFELRTAIRREAAATQAPVFTLRDFGVELTVKYASAQPILQQDFNGMRATNVTIHSVVLEPRRPLANTNYLQQRTFTAKSLKIQSAFYWPAPPSKGIGYKTAPLALWKETTVAGLTPEPLILRGEYSQTYRPGHHNFSEEFIFEPALEPGVSPVVLNQLQAANIQFIHVLWNFDDKPQISILGLDGKFRFLAL